MRLPNASVTTWTTSPTNTPTCESTNGLWTTRALGGPPAVCPLPSIRPGGIRLITNLSGFGLYRLRFEDTVPTYCTLLMKTPVAGLGALVEGANGRGLVFQMSLPPREFEAMSSPAIRSHLHRFRYADDDIPRLHREVHA